jgi:hypothetical protein
MRQPVCFLAFIGVVLAAGSQMSAAVVIEPAFEELVREAQAVLLTEAVSSRSSWRSGPDGRFIETTVTFRVDAVIKGAFVRERSLSFLGGRVGETTLSVSDMLQFNIGDRDVLFVADAGNLASPIVGFNHGRFKVTRDDTIVTFEEHAFSMDISRSGSSRLFAAPLDQAVTVNGFLAHIRATAAAAGISLR